MSLNALRNARNEAWGRVVSQSWDRAKVAAEYERACDAYETACRVWATRFCLAAQTA